MLSKKTYCWAACLHDFSSHLTDVMLFVLQVLEEQVRLKDNYITSSGSTLKTLELQQATAFTDIRGRIARCDAAIAKLASDLHHCQEGVKGTSGTQQTTYQKLQDKIQALELKVSVKV